MDEVFQFFGCMRCANDDRRQQAALLEFGAFNALKMRAVAISDWLRISKFRRMKTLARFSFFVGTAWT